MTANHVRLMCLAPLLFVFAQVLGCGPSGPVNDKVNKANLDKIQPGAKLADVEALLGPAQPSGPAPSAQAGDENLTWKKWQHSANGTEVIIGFDSRNEAEVVDKKMVTSSKTSESPN